MTIEVKTIVVSAVNIRKGGTLTILRQCLEYLSTLTKEYRVVALVHKRELCDYAGVEYIEMPDIIQGWGKRLWCEYVTMHRISKQLAPVYLWLSLHDTTPRVEAERQVVYCQTSFPFMPWKWQDLKFDYKIALFSMLTRFAYQINIQRNRYLIVQAQWLRTGFARMFGLPEERFIVAPPQTTKTKTKTKTGPSELDELTKTKTKTKTGHAGCKPYTFLFAATADCHKNFEVICEAAEMLEKEIGKYMFRVVLTINGSENKYAAWLKGRWGKVSSINFHGFMSKEELFRNYAEDECLIFPSRIETWGLPISEFAAYGKPMLLADLPYAHETAAGSQHVGFFDSNNAHELKEKMKALVNGEENFLQPVPEVKIEEPKAESWEELFRVLLN